MTKTSEIIRRARQLADLEGTDFVSWSENIQLINEAYTSLYQKLINMGDKSFLKSLHISTGSTKLPSDFWQLKGVYQYNNGNLQTIERRAENGSLNSLFYDIVNSELIIYGSCADVLVEYFPKPQFLTYPNKTLEVELDTAKQYIGCYAHKFYFYENSKLVELDLDNETEIDIATLEREPDLVAYVSEKWIVLLNEVSEITVINLITNATKTFTLEEIIQEEKYKKYFVVVDENDSLYVVEESIAIVPEIIYKVENPIAELLKLNDSLEAQPTGKFIHTVDYGLLDFGVLNKNGDVFYNAVYVDVASSDPTAALFVNDAKMLQLTDPAQIRIYDDKFYFINGNKICLLSEDGIKNVGIAKGKDVVLFNSHNLFTGYGVLSATYPDEGTPHFYMTSFLEDTQLNFPNSFQFNMMSYMLACSYKIKQNADPTGLVSQLQSMEQSFMDSLGSDAYQMPRMGNVY